MTNYNGVNYEKQYVTKPSEKIDKGEVAGRKRLLFDQYQPALALQVGDKILGLSIPANSLVTDAKVKVNKSLGATGIFDLGHLASDDDAADADAFVKSADAGGQAVLKRADETCVGIHKRFTADTQVVLECTEVMDGTVLDAVITFEVEYVND